MIEGRCLGCGKRYRLKGDPNAVEFLSLPCPECGGMLEITGETEEIAIDDFLFDKPLALVFWEGIPGREDFLEELSGLGYEGRTINRPSLLIQWLRYHTPALLVLACEEEGLQPFLEILNRLALPERRQIFVAWISPEAKTLDPKTAFLKSIQLVIGREDLARFGEILNRGKQIWDEFYASFREVQEQMKESLI